MPHERSEQMPIRRQLPAEYEGVVDDGTVLIDCFKAHDESVLTVVSEVPEKVRQFKTEAQSHALGLLPLTGDIGSAWWAGVQMIGPVLTVAASSAAAAGAYRLLDAWVKARNGRKLKIRVGDIEVEATQLAEKDVLRIFELLQENVDRRKIREHLIAAQNGGFITEGDLRKLYKLK